MEGSTSSPDYQFVEGGGTCPECGGPSNRLISPNATTDLICVACERVENEADQEARERRNATMRLGRIGELLSDVGVNWRGYGHCTLEGFDPKPDAHALEMTRAMVDRFRTGERPGLYLYARRGRDGLCTGNGKTHLAVAAVREIMLRPGLPTQRIRVVGAAELTLRIRDAWNRKVSTWELIQPHRLAELLVLDDLGVETTDGWAVEALYTLMESRLGRSTIITSNLTLQEQAERDAGIMERVVSRIVEQCDPVELKGPDRRIDMAKARRAVAKPQ